MTAILQKDAQKMLHRYRLQAWRLKARKIADTFTSDQHQGISIPSNN